MAVTTTSTVRLKHDDLFGMANDCRSRASLLLIDRAIADPRAIPIAINVALSRRISACLRVAPNIRIGLYPLRVALHSIGGEKHAHYWIIVPSHIIIQPRDAIGALAGESNAGRQCACTVAPVAIGSIELGANDCAAAVQHERLTAQGVVAEVIEGAVNSGSDTLTSDAIICGGLGGTASGLHLLDATDAILEEGVPVVPDTLLPYALSRKQKE